MPKTLFAFLVTFLITWNASAKSQSPLEVTGHQPQQSQTQNVKQQATFDKLGTEKSPIFVKVLPIPKTQEEITTEKKEREEKATNDHNLSTYTMWLVIVGVLQIFIFVFQLFFFRYQALKLRETVDIMADTAVRQLRAYISVFPRILGVQIGQSPVAVVAIENRGQTPAYRLTQIGGIGIGISFGILSPPGNHATVSLSPLSPRDKTEVRIVLNRVLTAEDIASLLNGSVTLWVFGEIHYTDAFNNDRFIRYRFMIGGPAGINSEYMAICEEGNDQD